MEYLYSNPYIATIVIIGLPLLYFIKKYFDGNSCELIADLSDKIIIITGASSGIGRETARSLGIIIKLTFNQAFMRARIIFACRNQEKTTKIIQEIKQETNNEKLEFMFLDLTRVMESTFKKTEDGNEYNFWVNYMGPFFLLSVISPCIMVSQKSRIINVTCENHRNCLDQIDFEKINDKRYFEVNGNEVNTYNIAKMALILFTLHYSSILKEQSKVISVNPGKFNLKIIFVGTTRTDLFSSCKTRNPVKNLIKLLWLPITYLTTKDALQGAQSVIYCALENWDKLKTGGYYEECLLSQPSPLASDEQYAEALYNETLNEFGFI